jgi:hypothetical protein
MITQVEQKAELVKSQKDIVGAYNILPLDPGASKQAIRMLPEVIHLTTTETQ